MTLSVDVSGDAKAAAGREVPTLDASDVATRLVGQDPTLWGKAAESESAIRLGWLAAPTVSRPLVAEIEALRDELRAEGVDKFDASWAELQGTVSDELARFATADSTAEAQQ